MINSHSRSRLVKIGKEVIHPRYSNNFNIKPKFLRANGVTLLFAKFKELNDYVLINVDKLLADNGNANKPRVYISSLQKARQYEHAEKSQALKNACEQLSQYNSVKEIPQ